MAILFMSILTVAVLGYWVLSATRQWNNSPEQRAATNAQSGIYDTPDAPLPFGYKTAWFALKTTDTEAVIHALDLSYVQKSSWQYGLNTLQEADGHLVMFVAPPVEGWTLVPHTVELGASDEEGLETLIQSLKALSTLFGEAHHYGSHRLVDYTSWLVAKNGNLTRAVSYVGDDGYLANTGPVTDIETTLGLGYLSEESLAGLEGLDFLSDDPGQPRAPEETDVVALAGAWSVNPLTLGDIDLPPSVGTLGVLNRPPRR